MVWNFLWLFSFVCFFVAGGKLVQVINFYFLLFSVIVLLRSKKFVMIVFLWNVCYTLLEKKNLIDLKAEHEKVD